MKNEGSYFLTVRVSSRVLALAKHVIVTPLPSVRSEYTSKGCRKRTLQPWTHGSVVMQNWNQMNWQISMQSWQQKKPDLFSHQASTSLSEAKSAVLKTMLKS